MELTTSRAIDIPWELIEAIKTFPVTRTVEHCGTTFSVSPFDFYAQCPKCGTRMKVRSCAAVTEIEEVFDAVFEWMSKPGAEEMVRQRQQAMAADAES